MYGMWADKSRRCLCYSISVIPGEIPCLALDFKCCAVFHEFHLYSGPDIWWVKSSGAGSSSVSKHLGCQLHLSWFSCNVCLVWYYLLLLTTLMRQPGWGVVVIPQRQECWSLTISPSAEQEDCH